MINKTSKKLPNFIIAGFPKCGTTSLYQYFNSHDDIYMPDQKELHYFTYPILSKSINGVGDKEVNKYHINTLEEYMFCFSKVSHEKAIGDASPSYANYPEEAIPKIKELLGDPKIIIVLRDPIKRAYSNYLHLKRTGRETLSFYEALLKEEERIKLGYSDFWHYSFNSIYFDKIKKYIDNFSDVKIVVFEEYVKDIVKNTQDLYQFLGVDSNVEPKNLNVTFNPGGVYSENIITKFIFSHNIFRSFIKKHMKVTPFMKKLKVRVLQTFKKPTPKIDEEAERFLINKFKKDVQKLNKELNVNIEFWNPEFNK